MAKVLDRPAGRAEHDAVRERIGKRSRALASLCPRRGRSLRSGDEPGATDRGLRRGTRARTQTSGRSAAARSRTTAASTVATPRWPRRQEQASRETWATSSELASARTHVAWRCRLVWWRVAG